MEMVKKEWQSELVSTLLGEHDDFFSEFTGNSVSLSGCGWYLESLWENWSGVSGS